MSVSGPEMIQSADQQEAERTWLRVYPGYASGFAYTKTMRESWALAPDTPARVLHSLVSDPDSHIRRALARRSAPLDPDILGILACDPEFSVRLSVARRIDTPVRALMLLATDHVYQNAIRIEVAANLATPVETLAELAHAGVPEIAAAVAGNPSTPVDTLMELVRVHNQQVRYNLICNPATPAVVLRLLAENRETIRVRMGVAAHVNTETAVLVKLIAEAGPDVVKVALSNPNCPTHLRAISALGR